MESCGFEQAKVLVKISSCRTCEVFLAFDVNHHTRSSTYVAMSVSKVGGYSGFARLLLQIAQLVPRLIENLVFFLQHDHIFRPVRPEMINRYALGWVCFKIVYFAG